MAPLMNPRTLWACQPVAAIKSLSAAPSGLRSSSRIAAFLLTSRASLATVGLSRAVFLRPLVAGRLGLGGAPRANVVRRGGLFLGLRRCLQALDGFSDAGQGRFGIGGLC